MTERANRWRPSMPNTGCSDSAGIARRPPRVPRGCHRLHRWRHAGILNTWFYESDSDVEGFHFTGERFTDRLQRELGSAAWASGVRPPVPSLPRQQTSARRRRCSWPAHLRYAVFHPGPSPSRYTSASEISIAQLANKRRNRKSGLLKRRFRCPSSTPPCESLIEHYPSGSVVARVFLTANPPVYAPVDQSLAHCGREKKMIQAHTLV